MEQMDELNPAPAETAPAREGSTEPQTPVPEAINRRAESLMQEAKTISEICGTDMLSLMETNPDVRTQVLEEGRSFAQAYLTLRHNAAPPAVRSANGGLPAMRVSDMSDREFARLNRMLKEGRTLSV